MFVQRLTLGLRTSVRKTIRLAIAIVHGDYEQEALRDLDPRDLPCDDFLDSPGVEEPEDVSVGEQEEHRDPQRSDLESDADLPVFVDPGIGRRHRGVPLSRCSSWQ